MTRFRDIRDQERAPKPSCLSCGSERLGAVREPLELSGWVYCGSCGDLMVADVVDDRPGVRKPTTDELLASRDDEAIKRIQRAFVLDKLDAAGNLKDKAVGPRLEDFSPTTPERPGPR